MTQATEGLFEEGKTPTDQVGADGKPVASASGDPASGALALLVGEGRKYKTQEDLAGAYVKADEHIARLVADNAKLKEAAAQGKTFEDVLERLEASRKLNSGDPADAPKSMTAQDIATIVREQLTGLETGRTRAANIAKAQAILTEKFGEKAKEVYLAQADTAEKKAALNDLAAVSPEMFVALFLRESNVGNQSDSGSKGSLEKVSIQSTGRAADSECKEYYEALRKKDPKAFYSHGIQLKMQKQAVNNPDKWFGRRVG